MRECWNWQTGMTKDHVSVGSEGSSPFSRIVFYASALKQSVGVFLLHFSKKSAVAGAVSYHIKMAL